MNWILQLLTSRVIIAAIAGTVIAQIIKAIADMIRYKKFEFDYLFKTGGMPSSHSAAIVAMTSALYLVYGFGPYFIISVVLTVVILRDALGVRKTVGEIGNRLNEMLEKDKSKGKKIHVNQGHTLMQVIVGSIVGWLCAIIVCGV